MAYQNQSITYVPAVLFIAGVRRAFEPIRVINIVLYHAVSCSLKVFHVSPKREFAHFYICLYSNKITIFCCYILKAKLIQAFMNGNKSLTWPQVNALFCAWSRVMRRVHALGGEACVCIVRIHVPEPMINEWSSFAFERGRLSPFDITYVRSIIQHQERTITRISYKL